MAIPSAALFDRNVVVARNLATTDGQGGFTKRYGVIGTEVGRLNPAGSSERDQADQLNAVVTYVMYFQTSAEILRDDRLIVGDQKFRVVSVIEPSETGVYKKALLEEVQRG